MAAMAEADIGSRTVQVYGMRMIRRPPAGNRLTAWYYFNNKGYIVTGWQKLDGTWYYLNPSNGIMMTGWQAINGKWYYMNGSGEMQTGLAGH